LEWRKKEKKKKTGTKKEQPSGGRKDGRENKNEHKSNFLSLFSPPPKG
jgi:hypothetical protein